MKKFVFLMSFLLVTLLSISCKKDSTVTVHWIDSDNKAQSKGFAVGSDGKLTYDAISEVGTWYFSEKPNTIKVGTDTYNIRYTNPIFASKKSTVNDDEFKYESVTDAIYDETKYEAVGN